MPVSKNPYLTALRTQSSGGSGGSEEESKRSRAEFVRKVVEALETSLGNIEAAAKSLQVSRRTMFRYVREHEEIAAALQKIRCSA